MMESPRGYTYVPGTNIGLPRSTYSTVLDCRVAVAYYYHLSRTHHSFLISIYFSFSELHIMNKEEETWSKAWRNTLDDPNATKAQRDFAYTQLNDRIGMGQRFTGKATQIRKKNASGWDLINSYECGVWNNPDPNVIVSLASQEILSRQVDKGQGPILMSARILKPGVGDVVAAYPKLHTAAQHLIADRKTTSENKSHAYVVMNQLYKRSVRDKDGSAIDYLKKALNLCPNDWRLHSLLGTEHMAIHNTALALEFVCRAEELATDDLAKFDLGIRKGKTIMNLGRLQDAADVFEEVLRLYDEELKNHPSMNDRMIAHLAVAEYMLVQCCSISGKNSKAKRHFYAAEEKRESLDTEVAQAIDWGNRMLAQMIVSKINPEALSHGKCHACGKITEKRLQCSACKTAFYCSKECQKVAWKQGHKEECKKLRAERYQTKREIKQEINAKQATRNLPPLDADLDPKQLWEEAVLLSNSGHFEDSAWKFLIALFMDMGSDANDRAPAKSAVNGCDSDNPVAMALSTITHLDPRQPLKRGIDMMNKAKCLELGRLELGFPFINQESPESIESVNRKVFGFGMCRIMYARMLGRCFAVNSAEQAASRQRRTAFEDIAKLVAESIIYVDPHRWLTLQFELGYSSMDVGATKEAKEWLKRFATSVDLLSAQKDGGLSPHWTQMRSKAETRLQMIPLMERMTPGGLT
jgi:tetratricopeptide (TPR) repeat protein